MVSRLLGILLLERMAQCVLVSKSPDDYDVKNYNLYFQRTAQFGPQPGSYDANGTLTLASPFDEPYLCTSPNQSDYFAGAIVLVLRGGGCFFSHKVLLAQAAGARGVIVGDNMVEDLFIMAEAPEDDNSSFLIPAVLVEYRSFVEMTLLLRNAGPVIAILDGQGELSDSWSLEWMLQVTAIMGLSFITSVAVFGAWRYVRAWRARSVRLDVAQRMPLMQFATANYGSDPERRVVVNDSCAICLDDFTNVDRLKVLPCRHGFHTPCIDQWLERSDLCPICKHSVLEVPEDDAVFRAMQGRRRWWCW